jgi:hypothetical protein
MTSAQIPESQQSLPRTLARPEAAGVWRLSAGTALSLRPRRRGVLEVAQGRVWLTVNSATDHVLEAGARMTVDAGQHAVLEAWVPGAAVAGAEAEAAAFRWAAADAIQTAAVPAAPQAAAEWEQTVAQPVRELVHALAQALAAAGRAVRGLGRFARQLLRTANPASPVLAMQCEKSING